MPNWLRGHDWSLGNVLALASVAATIVVAVVTPIRRGLVRLIKVGLLRAGRPERRYASWFVEKWGIYDNPYLADSENLDLSSTYVSLSFRAPEEEQETRTVATKVLADRDAGNLIVEGAPGSGKSTLLKAYGVGVLKSHHPLWRRVARRGDIPFLVQLRKFARYPDRDAALARYLVDEVLVSGAGMPLGDAEEFLRHALGESRVLVMLDGLDEVPAERYSSVLEAVAAFARDRNPDRPTYRARIIVTCRRQNFLAIRDEWVPAIARTVCTLAPLHNSEIFSYLDKMRTKFVTANGPEGFFNAVRDSGTLDLHRVPLILAMSVGLYARKSFYEIPNSISKLYQTMIEEMLDRHRFKRDPGGGMLNFRLDDKHRFLREFAFDRVLSPEGFNDFGRDDLLDHAQALAPRLDAVSDPNTFVKEIIDRSGLLSDVAEVGRYVFVHRSIAEHLVAEELRLAADGDQTLLRRADDPEWRQVILFYANALEQRKADTFLPDLAQRNVTLAGHCLAGAKPSDEVAQAILDRLRTPQPVHIAALVTASTSPRRTVQQMAVTRLEAQLLASLEAVRSAFTGDVDGMLPLLSTLAGSNAARIAALVPDIVASIPDDPRLVEPLWRCLATPEVEHQPASPNIVERLLTIAMDPDGLDELQKQEPYSSDLLTESVRRRAYPFVKGLPLTSNLVALLAWAEHLGVTPNKPNRYFQAKAADRLARVETDRRRTVSFSLFRFGHVMTAVATVASVAAFAFLIVQDWHVLLRPLGWWTPLLALGTAAAALVAALGLFALGESAPKDSRRRRYLYAEEYAQRGHFANRLVGLLPDPLPVFAGFGGPITFAFAVLPLATVSWPGYLATAILGPMLLFWLPALSGLFAKGARLYLYRPNDYIDMFDDPRSCHWLIPRHPGIPVAQRAMAAAD